MKILFPILFILTSCSTTSNILEGSSHACGTIHVEGYITDSQGDVKIVKAPDTWTPQEIKDFCP